MAVALRYRLAFSPFSLIFSSKPLTASVNTHQFDWSGTDFSTAVRGEHRVDRPEQPS
jgi:hypothetical protein